MGRNIPKRILKAQAKARPVRRSEKFKVDERKVDRMANEVMSALAKEMRPFSESAKIRFEKAFDTLVKGESLNIDEKRAAKRRVISLFSNEFYNDLAMEMLISLGESKEIGNLNLWIERNLKNYLERYSFLGSSESQFVINRAFQSVRNEAGVDTRVPDKLALGIYSAVYPFQEKKRRQGFPLY